MSTTGWKQIMQTNPMAAASDQATFWNDYLAQHPDVLHRLLADVYQLTHGTERPPTLDDLWQLVDAPRFAVVPFGQAVRDILPDRRLRWLAQEVGLHEAYVWKLLNGHRDIELKHDVQGSMRRLEAFAMALQVHPSYFMEWRRLWVMSLLDSAFSTQPTLSIGVYRRFSGFAGPRGNAR